MSSDRELAHIVRSWLEEGVNVLPDRVLDEVLAQLPVTSQRRPWWRAWRHQLMNSTLKLAAAAVAVMVVAAVAFAVYFSRSAVVPATSPSPRTSPSVTLASPTQPALINPTDSPLSPQTPQATLGAGIDAPLGLFLRHVNGDGLGDDADLWAIRADGTGAQEIFPGLGVPSVAWTQDGRRVVAVAGYRIYLAEASRDGIGPFADTGFTTGGDTACNEKSGQPLGCQDSAFTFAPDGQHIAFVQRCGWTRPGCMFLTTMDLRTGELTELGATLDTPDRPMELPAWSTDGSQIAFTREDAGVIGEHVAPESKLYVIGADGRNLRQIEVGGLSVHAPQWSPDGGEITFMSTDVYTVRTDGTDLHQLTNDALSSAPQWISSNQIRVRHWDPTLNSSTFALIDPDDASIVIEYDLVDLFEAIRAIEPPGSRVAISVSGDPDREFYWQPTP